ncbi:MAG: AI-2E family transporter, partial [Gemmatimonadales bacterium]
PTPPRDTIALGLAALLVIALLAGVRAVLSPPVVLALLFLALWPIRRRTGIRTVLVAGSLLTLLWLWHGYGAFLGPFVAALVLAYLLAPAVHQVERLGARRPLAVAGVLMPLLAVFVLGVLLIGPQIVDQSTALVGKLPAFATTLLRWLDGVRERLASLSLLSADQRSWLDNLDAAHLTAFLQAHASDVVGAIGNWTLGLLKQVGTAFGFLGYVIITPVVLFHALDQWPRITAFVRDVIPPDHRDALSTWMTEYDHKLGRYIRGALTEATLVGTLTGIGLAIAGVPGALLVAVVAGLCNLVPYVGLVVSALVAAMVGLTMDDPVNGLLRVAIVFGAVQLLDQAVTGPKIVGNSVGLDPAWIMVALTVSGAFFGFLGLLVAVPLAVLVKMLGSAALARYKASAAYAERP